MSDNILRCWGNIIIHIWEFFSNIFVSGPSVLHIPDLNLRFGMKIRILNRILPLVAQTSNPSEKYPSDPALLR
jgi:hypothetical protein